MQEATCVPDFPVLTPEEIVSTITFGQYQINQAAHYAEEHTHETGDFGIFIHRQAPDLVRAKIKSRHKSSTEYVAWVQFSPAGRTKGSVTGWYCKCKAGMRVVGCCAHVATIIWFLGYARFGHVDIKNNTPKYCQIIDSKGPGFSDSEDDDDADDDSE